MREPVVHHQGWPIYLILNLTYYSTSYLYGFRVVIKVINRACNLKTVLTDFATTVTVSKLWNVSNGCKLRSLSSVLADLFTPYYGHQTRSSLDSLTCSQISSAVWKSIPWGTPVGEACRLCYGSACGLALSPLTRHSYGFGLYNTPISEYDCIFYSNWFVRYPYIWENNK